MFNVGGGEVLVIALIALIVLGPQRLPSAARQAGKAMAELRRMSSGFQQELKSALDDTDDSKPRTPARDVLRTNAPRVADQRVSAAVQSVSEQTSGPAKRARPRREPLRAAPEAPGDDPAAGRSRSTS